MANATIAFAYAVRSNLQLSSKFGGVLAKLSRTQLDGDELLLELDSVRFRVHAVVDLHRWMKIGRILDAFLKYDSSDLHQLWMCGVRYDLICVQEIVRK